VTIDLLKPSFQPGKKLYEKVQFCLSDRISHVEFVCFAQDKVTGKHVDIKFPSDYKVQQLQNQKKKLKWKEIMAPTTLSFDSLSSTDINPEQFLLSMYEWIGAVSIQAE
jgi:hypothetical protein